MARRRAVRLTAIAALALVAGSAAPRADELRGVRIGLQAAGAGRAAFTLRRAMARMTPEDGYHLGRAAAARLLAGSTPIDDPEAIRYLNLVGSSLRLTSARPEVFAGYRFMVLADPDLNAFALPGAWVLITRGLLRVADDEDMLAAILAHEIAHVELDHGRLLIRRARWERFWKVSFGEALAATVTPPVVSALAGALDAMAGDYASGLIGRGYDRRLELLADRAAIDLLAATGYDPGALLDVLRALDQRAGRRRIALRRSHPDLGRRIAALERLGVAPGERPAVRARRFAAALGGIVAPGEE